MHGQKNIKLFQVSLAFECLNMSFTSPYFRDKVFCVDKKNYVRTLRLKRDGTREETRYRLSPKRTSPFKSAGASVQLTTGSRGVRISGSNAGYTTFRGCV